MRHGLTCHQTATANHNLILRSTRASHIAPGDSPARPRNAPLFRLGNDLSKPDKRPHIAQTKHPSGPLVLTVSETVRNGRGRRLEPMMTPNPTGADSAKPANSSTQGVGEGRSRVACYLRTDCPLSHTQHANHAVALHLASRFRHSGRVAGRSGFRQAR
jgi:hypothetical protein